MGSGRHIVQVVSPLGGKVLAEGQGTDVSNQDRDMALFLTCGRAWAHKGLWKLSLVIYEACIFFQFFN